MSEVKDMREILFRGKTVNTDRWAYGYFSYNFGNDAPQIREKTNCRSVIVVPETVGQYTGLTDKNGTKIFEGDIVKWIRTKMYCMSASWNGQDLVAICPVYFDEKTHGFAYKHYSDSKCIGGGSLSFNDSRAEENIIEVIGNVYDNPELIEE